MHSKFSGLAVEANDVMAYYSPNGGGYGSALKRPGAQGARGRARRLLLRGARPRGLRRRGRLEAETVDVAATEALRARMSA